ncbi:ectin-like [Lingula anatina]|uniref:Ectin-like n=1 Tax=Lingula anatina TaxID=7574 RepID=A0A1S3K7Q7_LINAN|nr:ectin-like [Lingula anatina]|eukprot:XP_013418658.1 ectin-like [Lingula anatina]
MKFVGVVGIILSLSALTSAHAVAHGPDYVVWVAEWGTWSNFTICTASCGGGIKMRTRECILRKVHYHTLHSVGMRPSCCAGASVEIVPCNTHQCVIVGGWSPWSINTGCCNGLKIRHRTCTHPPPVNSPECAGHAVDSVMCGPEDKEICVACPRDCPRPYMFHHHHHHGPDDGHVHDHVLHRK